MPDETILDRNRLTAFRLIGYPLHSEPQPPNVPRAAAVVFLARFCYHKAKRQSKEMLQHPGGLLPGCGSAVGPRLLCRPRIRIRSQGRKYVSAAVPQAHRVRMGSVCVRLCNAAIRQQPDRPVGTEPTLGAGSAKLTAACRCHVSKAGAQEHKTEDV